MRHGDPMPHESDLDDAMARHPAGKALADYYDGYLDHLAAKQGSTPDAMSDGATAVDGWEQLQEARLIIGDVTEQRDELIQQLADCRGAVVRRGDETQPMADAKHWRALCEARATIARVENLADAWDREAEAYGDKWGPYSFTIALRKALASQ